jgi:predicted dehydrogenase
MSLAVGFLGAGLIAGYHAASLERSGAAARVSAVFDPDAERARRFAARYGARVVGSEADVVAEAEAVYVCTWTSEHARLVDLVCGAGRAVFCEKPLSTDLAGATAMTDAVARAGVVNQVGLVLRSVPGFALLRHLVRQQHAVGRVVSIGFRDDQQIPLGGYYGSDWRGDRHRAGSGTLLEHSIHDLDLLEWLAGPLSRVSAALDNLHGLDGVEDSVAVSFTLAAGGTGVLTSVWHDVEGRLSNRRLEIFAQRARLWAEGNAAEQVGWELEAGQPEQREGDGLWSELERRGAARPVNADAAFVDAARTGRPAHPDFATALRAHHLVDAVYRSAAAGGAPVVIPPPEAS